MILEPIKRSKGLVLELLGLVVLLKSREVADPDGVVVKDLPLQWVLQPSALVDVVEHAIEHRDVNISEGEVAESILFSILEQVVQTLNRSQQFLVSGGLLKLGFVVLSENPFAEENRNVIDDSLHLLDEGLVLRRLADEGPVSSGLGELVRESLALAQLKVSIDDHGEVGEAESFVDEGLPDSGPGLLRGVDLLKIDLEVLEDESGDMGSTSGVPVV